MPDNSDSFPTSRGREEASFEGFVEFLRRHGAYWVLRLGIIAASAIFIATITVVSAIDDQRMLVSFSLKLLQLCKYLVVMSFVVAPFILMVSINVLKMSAGRWARLAMRSALFVQFSFVIISSLALWLLFDQLIAIVASASVPAGK